MACDITIAQINTIVDTIQGFIRRPDAMRTASSHSAGLIKLPPVFVAEDGRYGDGRQNLIAMLRVATEYEMGLPDGTRLTLASLPDRYNRYGGQPVLTTRDMRKVHNWLQQVSLAMRAAMVVQEMQAPPSRQSVAERVWSRLYDRDSSRRTFATYPPDSRYTLKPLRNVGRETILPWIRQECRQIEAWQQGKSVKFGAEPSQAEWDRYGVRPQSKTLTAEFSEDLMTLVRIASAFDKEGQFDKADAISERLEEMCRQFFSFGSIPA